ncbi:energy transducer TonB family protein [Alistipes sp.]|uniref:energy transducer TonB family protein n=1 Tax=Alistipes sp. TaxID=1872444 RepID=UPI003A884FBA
MTPQETPPRPRRPKLHLPFDNRREDAGEWAFDHRAGLCVTLIAYLLLAIAFVGSKIVVGGTSRTQGFYIDLQQLEQLAAEKERLEREVHERQRQEPVDWKSIRNDVSNENAKLDESLRDDRGTNTAALNEAADAAQEHMRANRAAYEQGLAEAEAIGRRGKQTQDAAENSDRKVQGRVTVSFSLVDPVRHARHLEVPAYQCEGGGEVVVRITVDRSGEVTHASVASGGDDCMRETAVRAARRSRFDINQSAPARHTGTITYIFIPQ